MLDKKRIASREALVKAQGNYISQLEDEKLNDNFRIRYLELQLKKHKNNVISKILQYLVIAELAWIIIYSVGTGATDISSIFSPIKKTKPIVDKQNSSLAYPMTIGIVRNGKNNTYIFKGETYSLDELLSKIDELLEKGVITKDQQFMVDDPEAVGPYNKLKNSFNAKKLKVVGFSDK